MLTPIQKEQLREMIYSNANARELSARISTMSDADVLVEIGKWKADMLPKVQARLDATAKLLYLLKET